MSGLDWLSRAPEDFGTRVRAAVARPEFAELAAHDLSFQQLDQLGRRLKRHTGEERASDAMTLGLLGSGTLDLLAPSIEASGLRHGLDVRVVTGQYGQPLQDALDPDSEFNVAKPDAVLLCLDHRTLPFPKPNGSGTDALSAARTQFNTIVEALKGQGVKLIIVQTVPLIPESLFGHYDRQTELSLNRRLRRWNDELVERCAKDDALILMDADDLASRVGRQSWYNPVQWQMAKLPFDQQRVPLYADHVARLLAAVRGKSRKCLVLDLDNTLWGGVIGDDGMEGILLGSGSPEGEAFVAIQQMALALRERGVVLAVCSKNEEETAKEPFRAHSEMVLKLDDIAVFIANWQPKSDNIREIARRLNIGTDALVFLDDNPAERAQVRGALPEVAVPELPDDPARYPEAIWQAGYFETVAVSADDMKRADQYKANAAREALAAESTDLGSFLKSLDMKADVASFRDHDMVRVTQLINKTNQFNLTTRRYTQAEVAAMASDPSVYTLQVRLIDCFGDNGIICLVICREADSVWEIDTWLMSCRVLKRDVERMVLDQLVAAARERGISAIEGVYIETARNAMVAQHYPNLGFAPLIGTSGRWRLAVGTYEPSEAPIDVRRID